VHGPSVARGYWRRAAEAAQTFDARLADAPTQADLRTGDLGFVGDGGLSIAGRIKDPIIVRGRQLYSPELRLPGEHVPPALRPGCGAVVAIERAGAEFLVVVQEFDRRHRPDRRQDRDEVLGSDRRGAGDRRQDDPAVGAFDGTLAAEARAPRESQPPSLDPLD